MPCSNTTAVRARGPITTESQLLCAQRHTLVPLQQHATVHQNRIQQSASPYNTLHGHACLLCLPPPLPSSVTSHCRAGFVAVDVVLALLVTGFIISTLVGCARNLACTGCMDMLSTLWSRKVSLLLDCLTSAAMIISESPFFSPSMTGRLSDVLAVLVSDYRCSYAEH